MGRRWIGRWVVAVSALHTLFGLFAFAPTLRAMAKAGLWNSVGSDAMRGAVAWFLLSGGFMLVAGLAIDGLEQSDAADAFDTIGWGLLFVTAITIVLMPVSGAWLLLPPAVAMIRRTVRN
jgi:hypothetical protein